MKQIAILILVSAAFGFGMPLLATPLLPASEPGYSYTIIAASFFVNLTCLAFALAVFPDENDYTSRGRIPPNLRGLLTIVLAAAAAHVGMFLSPVHKESARVFVALWLLTAGQAAMLGVVHALLALTLGYKSRLPRTACAVLLCVLASALFWTREPIERLARSGVEGDTRAGYVINGVMQLSPPAAVSSAWFLESDGGRGAQGAAVSAANEDVHSTRRFDLIKGQLTYAVWIGTYKPVASNEILPSGMSGDFYAQKEFAPGLAMTMWIWALPLLILADVLVWVGRRYGWM